MQSPTKRFAVPREVVPWKPPTAGLFKINFDGAIFENLALAGLGIVIRRARDDHCRPWPANPTAQYGRHG